MEEIIASIGRIIAEDGATRGPVSAAAEDDVLELTEALAEDGSVRRIEPATGDPGSAAAVPATPAEYEPRLSAPEPPRPGAAEPVAGRGRLLSEATAQAAAAAFARLGAEPQGRGAAGELPVGAAARTLEEIVRDALRPLLERWLEDHLPAIVERLVREEIARVADAAVRR